MTSGYTPYTIANMKTGLEQDMDSFLVADDAFPYLNNAYLWRGRVYKKGGNQLLGRLGNRSEILVMTRGAGNTAINMNLTGAPIDPGSIVVTDGVTTFADTGNTSSPGANWTVSPGGNGTVQATTNYTTGNIQITFTAANPGATIVATYLVAVSANSPVMGLRRFINPSSSIDGLIAFDLLKSYAYSTVSLSFVDITQYKLTGLEFSWSGTNYDFFWTTNWENAMWTTNGVPGSNFYLITGASNSNPVTITTSVPNALVTGDVVVIQNIGYATGFLSSINEYAVTVTSATTFTIPVDTTAFGAYTPNSGIVYVISRSIQGDGIKWYDGTGWVNFNPPTNGSIRPNIVIGAELIFAYKDYLVLLNTTEANTAVLTAGVPLTTNFFNRARWCKPRGNIFYSYPIPNGYTGIPNQTNWYDTFGNTTTEAGFQDAPTQQTIIAAEFIKDTLIVYFDTSIYRLTYTGNPNAPFIWEKINTELGAISTFSTVPFDRQILTVSNNGIYGTDSVNVERVDRIIPDIVFGFQKVNQGQQRVYSIRDYFSEQCYWTYVDPTLSEGANVNPTFPNSLLVYNYLTKSYAIFNTSYTCFGHFRTIAQQTWGSLTGTFGSYNQTWGSFAQQAQVPVVVGGNQQGFVFSLTEVDGSDFSFNATSLVISAISNANPSVFTVINHNLQIGSFISISGTGIAGIDGTTFRVLSIIDVNNFTLVAETGIPVTIASYPMLTGRISLVDNVDIVTKNFNPFFTQGRSMRLGFVDFYFEVATGAFITVNLYQNDGAGPPGGDPIETHIIDLTDGYDASNSMFFRRVYFQSQGQFLRLELTYSDYTIPESLDGEEGQMFEPSNTSTPLTLHGIIMWMKPAGRLLTNS